MATAETAVVWVWAMQDDVGAMLVDGAMQREARRIRRILGRLDQLTFDTDLQQVLGRDFAVIEAEGIHQIVMRRPRQRAPRCD